MLKKAWLLAPVLALAGVAACGGGGGGSDGGGFVVPDGYPYPVQTPEVIDDRTHMAVGQVYDGYTSDPPTSGPHTLAPAPWGISEEVLAKEVPVHNMEHAGVVVWYSCNAGEPLSADACAQRKNDLAAVVSPLLGEGYRVLMTQYPSMDTQIALTGWGFLDSFDEFDAARIEMFVTTFECNFDPEGFCR